MHKWVDSVTFDITEKKTKSLAYLPIGNRIAVTHGLIVGRCLFWSSGKFPAMFSSTFLVILLFDTCLLLSVHIYIS